MGRLQTKAECEYGESDQLLTEQFIGGLNDGEMTDEILREMTMLENTESATKECMLIWMHIVKVQKAQRSMLNNIKESKDFGMIQQNT